MLIKKIKRLWKKKKHTKKESRRAIKKKKAEKRRNGEWYCSGFMCRVKKDQKKIDDYKVLFGKITSFLRPNCFMKKLEIMIWEKTEV